MNDKQKGPPMRSCLQAVSQEFYLSSGHTTRQAGSLTFAAQAAMWRVPHACNLTCSDGKALCLAAQHSVLLMSEIACPDV